MKLYGYLKGNGKLGNIVVSQVGGETIARDYQPNVSNPNTQMQVNQRGRFKLMTQIAAALAPVIAIPKKGLVSGRNQFVSRNIGQVYANDNVTSVSVENLQLTAGSSGLPAVVASRTAAAGSVSVKLASSAAMACSRVVYCMFVKTSYERLQYVTSIVADDVDGDGLFSAQLPAVGADAVIYAYGIKDLNAAASAAYGNYGVQNGEDVARLILSRSLSMSDYSFTQTRGTTLYGGELDNDAPGEGETKIYVTVNGNGSVTGGGIITYGETAKLQATPAEGSTFVGWVENGSKNVISQNPTLMFKAEQISDYVAIFSNPANPYLAPNGQPLVNGLPLQNVVLKFDNGEEHFISSGLVTIEEPDDATEMYINAPAGQSLEYRVGGVIITPTYNAGTGNYVFDDFADVPAGVSPWEGQLFYNGYPWVYITLPEWENPLPGSKIFYLDENDVRHYLTPNYKGVISVDVDYLPNIGVEGVDEDTELSFNYGPNWNLPLEMNWDADLQALFVDISDYNVSDSFIFGDSFAYVGVKTQGWNNLFPYADVDGIEIVEHIVSPHDYGQCKLDGIAVLPGVTITMETDDDSTTFAYSQQQGRWICNEWNPGPNAVVRCKVNGKLWFDGIQS